MRRPTGLLSRVRQKTPCISPTAPVPSQQKSPSSLASQGRIWLLSGANAGIEALWQARLLTTAQCDRALVLGVETFQECAELYTTGRWLLGTPLLEAAACLVLERHPSHAAVRYRAASGTRGLARLVAGEREGALASVYLCTPTARAGQMAGHYLQAQWPDISLVLLHERLGICLACAPLIALMLAATASQKMSC